MPDMIQYQYNTSLEEYALECYHDPPSMEDVLQDTQLGECLQNSSPSVLFMDTDTSPSLQLEPVLQGMRPQTHASFPGSSNGSNLSLDGSGLMFQVASLPPSLTSSPCSKKPKFSENGNPSKPEAEVASEQGHYKYPKHAHKEGSKAKNIEVERKRRSRIKEGEFQLRALVPNISKMDRASIIGDAIEYIIKLEKTIKELKEELKKDDHGENTDQGSAKFCSKQKNRCEIKNSEVQVEVRRISEQNFLLRIEAEQQPSGFSRLMEVVSSAGLQVEDVNVTSCHGLIICSFRVETDREVHQDQLRETLVQGFRTEACLENGHGADTKKIEMNHC